MRVGKNIANAWRANGKRTRRLGLASTLTAEQWLETLALFKGNCAYCGLEAQCMDHYIPVLFGGGTTWANCVPSCLGCNAAKGNHVGLRLPPKGTSYVLDLMEVMDAFDDDTCHYGPTLATSWCLESQGAFADGERYASYFGIELLYRSRLLKAAKRFGFYKKERRK